MPPQTPLSVAFRRCGWLRRPLAPDLAKLHLDPEPKLHKFFAAYVLVSAISIFENLAKFSRGFQGFGCIRTCLEPFGLRPIQTHSAHLDLDADNESTKPDRLFCNACFTQYATKGFFERLGRQTGACEHCKLVRLQG